MSIPMPITAPITMPVSTPMRPSLSQRKPAAPMVILSFSMAVLCGCATKNYVRTQTAPLINQENELNDKTAQNNRAIHDTDERAKAGVAQAQSAADAATVDARKAQTDGGTAEVAANDAVHRADSLAGVVQGLDRYKTIGNLSVTFGFDKAVLTQEDKAQLDTFAANLGGMKSYILEVTGGTDSAGSAEYNYALSQRRADAVVQYLASKYEIPAHRFYLIGIGKDKEVADNATRAGRARNRRVEVRLLSNMAGESAPAATPASLTPAPGGR